MVWRGVTGLAKGLTRGIEAGQEEERLKKRMAYESMLRGQERATPAAMHPTQEANVQARTAQSQAQTEHTQAQTVELLSKKRTGEYQKNFDLYVKAKRSGNKEMMSFLKGYMSNSAVKDYGPEGIFADAEGPEHDMARDYASDLDNKKFEKIIGMYETQQEAEKPKKWDLLKEAQDEATRRLGGSQMMGLRKNVQSQYAPLVNQIYNGFLKQFGYPAENMPTINTVTQEPKPKKKGLFLRDKQPKKNLQDADTRFEELIKTMPEEEAYKTLIQEGF